MINLLFDLLKMMIRNKQFESKCFFKAFVGNFHSGIFFVTFEYNQDRHKRQTTNCAIEMTLTFYLGVEHKKRETLAFGRF